MYNSNMNLNLSNIPTIEDGELYVALLDMHNALQNILAASPSAGSFTLKVSTDYSVMISDSTIEVDASAGDVVITLPSPAAAALSRYDIKRVDTEAANSVTVVSSDSGTLDDAASVVLASKDSITVRANAELTGWLIL